MTDSERALLMAIGEQALTAPNTLERVAANGRIKHWMHQIKRERDNPPQSR